MARVLSAQAEVTEQIATLELSLLQAPTRFDGDYLERTLDDCVIEFGKSGRICDKRSIIKGLASEQADTPPAELFEIVEAKASMLAADVVLFTYRLRVRPRLGAAAVPSLRSSVWRKSDNRWRLIFHQGTVAAE